MLSMLFDFTNGFLSFLNAFFFSFYYSIRFLIGFINAGHTPGYFVLCFITQVILIVITIIWGVKKGYSGFLTFLFCFAVPLLGSLILIALLPDDKDIMYSSSHKTSNLSYDTSPINIPTSSTSTEKKICEKCGQKVNADIYKCPKCGCESFK